MKNIKFISKLAVLISMLSLISACGVTKVPSSSGSSGSGGSSSVGGPGGTLGGSSGGDEQEDINNAIDSGNSVELKKLLKDKTPDQIEAIKKQKKNNSSLAANAIYNDNKNQLAALIENNLVDFDEKDVNGNNLLHGAAGRDPALVDLIVASKPELATMTNDLGNTPLMIAALYNLDSFIALAKSNQDLLKTKDTLGNTPLMIAAKNASSAEFDKALDALLALDGFQEETAKKALLEEKNIDGDTMMHLAARAGQADSVKKLLTLDNDLASSTNNSGYTPFLTAVREGKVSVVKTFIDVDLLFAQQKLKQSQYKEGEVVEVELNAAQIAVDGGNAEILNAILKSEPGLIKGLAYRAARFGKKLSIFETLYDKNNLIFDELNEKLDSPLLLFTQFSNQYDADVESFEIASYLLEHTVKSTVDFCTDTKLSPLHWALKNGNQEIVRAFIEKKANLEFECGGYKPIHTLMKNAHGKDHYISTLKLFIQSLDNVQINARDEKYDSTALLYAVINAAGSAPLNLKIIDALKAHEGLDPNIGKFKPLVHAVDMVIEPIILLGEKEPRYPKQYEANGWEFSYVNNVDKRVSTQGRRNEVINSLLEIKNIDFKDAFSRAAYHHDIATLETLFNKDPDLLKLKKDKTKEDTAPEANLAVSLAVAQVLSKEASDVKNKGTKTREMYAATNLLTENTNKTLDKLNKLGLEKEWFSKGILVDADGKQILWNPGTSDTLGPVSWYYFDVQKKLEALSK